MYQTLEQRYTLLKPDISIYGPKDDLPRPAVLLFHGCNGIYEHLHDYARQIEASGARAFIIDSFTPRGWNETFALTMVCTGFMLPGYERAGDVLAALWGIGARQDVDENQIILAGWSHGAWAITDLMTLDLTKSGDARLKDPSPAPLAGVKGVFIVYPYLGYPARSGSHPWHYFPKVSTILVTQDHLSSVNHGQSVMSGLQKQDIDVKVNILDATHCFDEDRMHLLPMMSYNKAAHNQAKAALNDLMGEALHYDGVLREKAEPK